MRMRSLPKDGLRSDNVMSGDGGVDVARIRRRRPCARGQANRQARAAPRRGVDVDGTLQMRDALADADQPETAPRLSRLEAGAVLLDRDRRGLVDPPQIDER